MKSRSFPFVELAGSILECGTRGPERLEFLQEVSRLILSQTHFDSIQVRARDDRLYYRWTLESASGASAYHRVEPDLSAPTDTPQLEPIRHGVLTGEIPDEHAGGFTPGRSYVGYLDATGETVVILALRKTLSPSADPVLGFVELRSRDRDFDIASQVDALEFLSGLLALSIATRRSQLQLNERVKELRCLYELSQLLHQRDIPFDSLFPEILKIVPRGFQFPESAQAAILLDARKYASDGFEACTAVIRAPLVLDERQCGEIRVGYPNDGIRGMENAFLPEEKSLIDAVAREIEVMLERRLFDEEKRRLESQLRHADRLSTVGELSAGIAHELNEPLSDILGFAELIGDERGLSSAVREDLQRIERSAMHMRTVVRELLTFARKLPEDNEQVDVNALVRETLAFLDGRFKSHGINVSSTLEGTIKPVMGVPGRVKQVLMNIIVNAIQAMPEGGSISVETRSTGSSVKVVIRDNGVGMSHDVQERIFLPFFTTKDVGEGTGLGLSVAHGIVASLGGTIAVESAPGEGTRFEISLPVAGVHSV